MRATIPILSLYEWNNNIFAELHVPAGVDKQGVINEILMECAELEALYPDPGFMRKAVRIWSDTEARDWNKFMEAAAAEFNPIHNYDRYEDWTDSGTGSGTSTNSVAGYNTDTLQPESKSEGSSNANSTHNGHLYGNIGVTTSSQMLKEFIDRQPQLNIYKYIAQSFKKRFCLMVY